MGYMYFHEMIAHQYPFIAGWPAILAGQLAIGKDINENRVYWFRKFPLSGFVNVKKQDDYLHL